MTIKQLDAYDGRIVTKGGCDNAATLELCFYDVSSPGELTELAGSYYGGHNSLWGDKAVWSTLQQDGDFYNVKGYDFLGSELFYITQDEETQLKPRFQGSTVVYMDLRFGDSQFSGNWNHSAVFAYDLVTHETTQVTSGEWIATYPDVYDGIVVWGDYRDCANPNNIGIYSCVEIWGYNLATGTEFKITDLPGRAKQTPRIWGDKVFVDMSKSTGGSAIFMFDLPDGAK